MKKNLLFICYFFAMTCISMFSCGSSSENNEPNKPTRAETLLNQSYGSDPKQKFDIHLPANRNVDSTPILFFIHGGGWAAGSKNDYDQMIQGFKGLLPNYAFATIGYRLAKDGVNIFPAQELDVKACIEYVMNKRRDYKISSKIALIGGSAGGHLCILYAYKYGSTSYRPMAVIDMTGPVEMASLYETTTTDQYKGWFRDAIGGLPKDNVELCRSSSPINYVSNNSSPTLMLYGKIDDIVHESQPAMLDAKLTEYNVPHRFILYPNSGHMLEEGGEQMVNDIKNFLETYVK